MSEQKVINLYDHYKNIPKKLKIVCDWDEVIQAHEPYALWKAKKRNENFPEFFNEFWANDGFKIDYSSFGSCLNLPLRNLIFQKQTEIKNSPNFYQEAPFLTIAKELLMLIKADKVEHVIFLSAYDKRKFPDRIERKCADCQVKNSDVSCRYCTRRSGDPRKYEIFVETFNKLREVVYNEKAGHGMNQSFCSLKLIGFDSEIQRQTKADWIKENASDFDLVIDDNPNICKSVLNEFISFGLCKDCRKESKKDCARCPKEFSAVYSPYYPAIENQHDKRVLLIKQEISDLKKEDFK